MAIDVFFIDDEALLCECFEQEFDSKDVRVKTFVDPVEALHHINSLDKQPDLIFTDYRMPKLNGDEFVKKLKFSGLPIYLVSGELATLPKFQFTSIILKPFHHQEIKKIVFDLLEQKNKTLRFHSSDKN